MDFDLCAPTRLVFFNIGQSLLVADQCQKRQDESKRTSQSPPTAPDQCQKNKKSGSAQVKVHQQRLTRVKKTRRVQCQKKTRRVGAPKPSYSLPIPPTVYP